MFGIFQCVIGYLLLCFGIVLVASERTEKKNSKTFFWSMHSFLIPMMIIVSSYSYVRHTREGIQEFANRELLSLFAPLLLITLGFTVLNYRSIKE